MITIDDYFNEYLDELLKGNRVECNRIVDLLIKNNLPIMDVYEKLFKRSLYEVGKLWEYNKISVAVEHMSTSITEALMNELFSDMVAKKRLNKKVVVACIEQEDHQVGGRMVADVFEQNGWDSYYLGASIPIQELIQFCELTQPDYISLSLTVYFNVFFLLKEIKEIQGALDIPILIGGQALLNKGNDIAKKFKNVYYLENLYDIERMINI